jgi:hypothetical protein
MLTGLIHFASTWWLFWTWCKESSENDNRYLFYLLLWCWECSPTPSSTFTWLYGLGVSLLIDPTSCMCGQTGLTEVHAPVIYYKAIWKSCIIGIASWDDRSYQHARCDLLECVSMGSHSCLKLSANICSCTCFLECSVWWVCRSCRIPLWLCCIVLYGLFLSVGIIAYESCRGRVCVWLRFWCSYGKCAAGMLLQACMFSCCDHLHLQELSFLSVFS